MKCSACSQEFQDGVVLCPYCGGSLAGFRGRATRWALGAGAAVLLVAGGAFAGAMGRSVHVAPRCDGGRVVGVDWKVEESTAPRDADAGKWGCLELRSPEGLSYVHLADVRHRGDATYAQKEQREFPHVHDSVCAAIRATGANAFYNDPPRAVAGGEFEVVSHAVLLYQGPPPTPGTPLTLVPEQRDCVVAAVDPGSSAAGAGLRAGDAFRSVDHTPVAGSDPCAAVQQRLGTVPRGSSVSVEVGGDATARTLTLSRPSAGPYGYRALVAPRGK